MLMTPTVLADISTTVAAKPDHVFEWAATPKIESKIPMRWWFANLVGAGHDAVPCTTPWVSSMVILGITLKERFSIEAHMTHLFSQARQSLYALSMLVAHGLQAHAARCGVQMPKCLKPPRPGGSTRSQPWAWSVCGTCHKNPTF